MNWIITIIDSIFVVVIKLFFKRVLCKIYDL